MNEDHGRDRLIGRSLDFFEYIRGSRKAFSTFEIAEALELHPRTALRWLRAMEGRDEVIEVFEGTRPCTPQKWKRVPHHLDLKKHAEANGLGVMVLDFYPPKPEDGEGIWHGHEVRAPIDRAQYTRLVTLLVEFQVEWPSFPQMKKTDV